jgi:hypothetical protein
LGQEPCVFCLDVDGTIYVYERNEKGELTKRGLSKEAKRIIEERQIPIILNSGRPDWNDSSDEELEKLGLPRADVVIAGAGTIVYFRTPSGNLVVDEEFINIIKNQRIVYRQRIDDSFYPLSEENYNPPRLQTYLTKYLGDKFTPFVRNIKIDQNPAGGFVTLDISEMPYLKLKELIELIKKGVGGIKLEFSEDLKKADDLENHFTGWIQVVPISEGKDKALRYLLTKICQKINPENRSDKKLEVYAFGDASMTYGC